MSTKATLLIALFARFGVTLNPAEMNLEAGHEPREAIVHLLADREVAARFDAAHGRPPNDDDVDELLDIYTTLAERGVT